jgi:GntR family transcriptional regulator
VPEPQSSDRLRSLFTDEWALDRADEVPAYAQIEERVMRLVESGRLAVGARLPSERDLAAWVGVSRLTARAALSSLAQRGLVERGVGRRGTVVSRAKLAYDLRDLAGFTEMVHRHGLSASARIRALGELAAPDAIAHELRVAPGASVYRVQRLRFANGEPLTLEDSWLPAARFPGLLDHDMCGSLYALMRDTYACPPVRAIERLEPILAAARQAHALDVAIGSPLMRVERQTYAADDSPVEFAEDYHRGDRAQFVVQVSTTSGSG